MPKRLSASFARAHSGSDFFLDRVWEELNAGGKAKAVGSNSSRDVHDETIHDIDALVVKIPLFH